MIGVRLEGGLGNQLFQYAAARSLAIRHATEIMIDRSVLNSKSTLITAREYELSVFNCPIAPSSRDSIPFSRLAKRFGWLFSLLTSWTVYIEKGQQYDANFLAAPDNSYLIGYWQSYRYFEAIKDTIRNDFTPKNSLSRKSLAIKKIIDLSSPSVAIHVRRGDYVNLPSAIHFHGALSIDYYHQAFDMMIKRFPDATYFVFSDDIDWCKGNLGLENKAIYVDHNRSIDAWQDLILMSACKHHIIANSSFSWWGAWLGGQNGQFSNQLVIYPKNWFKGRAINERDRFPLNWQGI